MMALLCHSSNFGAHQQDFLFLLGLLSCFALDTSSLEHVTMYISHCYVQGLMSQEDWDQASQAALALFSAGQEEAAKRGMLLVDTKYEFGKDASGKVMVVDEVHTPDSSRYWLADSYPERFAAGQVCCIHRLVHVY
jgi:phosphoribosylaminoimidazole-succinocarboxamide synthase